MDFICFFFAIGLLLLQSLEPFGNAFALRIGEGILRLFSLSRSDGQAVREEEIGITKAAKLG
jgi:hypothetical protein